MNLEIIIPSDEPVRLLSAIAEELDYSRLTATYSRSERIEHSPRLLFKIVLYGCTRGIYATREIERACRENVNFMYLLEGHRAPDHNTIARFRRDHLPYAVEDLLNQMIIFANGIAAFAITDPDSFSMDTVSDSLSQACIGIVLADRLRDGTIKLPLAKAMAESCINGVKPQKKESRNA